MIRVGPKVHTDADLDMTSLLDMVFILLIFFVIASSFVIKGLTFDLPSAKTSKSISGHIVEIELNKEGNYVCDGVPTAKEDLTFVIAGIVKRFKERPGQIVLKTDYEAPAGELIHLVDEIRLHGGEKFKIATSAKQREVAK